MKEEKTNITELAKIISKDLNPVSQDLLKKEARETIDNINELKDFLAQQIGVLIDEKYDLLINTLYRIDIDDKKLENLFAGGNRESIPTKLAELIIERQLQKLEFRKLHREGKF